MRVFLHYMKRIVIFILKTLLLLIPKDKNMILFSAWFGQKYSDSSMYMYEYLLKKSNYKVFWYTRNKEIYEKLNKEEKPVVYSKSLKGIWYHIRAKMLVSSIQLSDFNHYLLSKCIYLDLGHGFPLKEGGFKIPGTSKRMISYDKFLKLFIKYYGSASSEYSRRYIKECFNIKDNQIVFCNKPRTDVLFDEKLRKNKNVIVDEIKNGRKAIVYMPTHRSCGKVRQNMHEILNLDAIEKLCEKYNYVFIIKKHFYHRDEIEDFSKYKYIYDITLEDIDSEVLTYQADIMISDYSASYIDFLLLDRPIILYSYDLNEYLKNERGMYIKFEYIEVGYKPQNKKELLEELEKVLIDEKDEKHRAGRHKMKNIQFDKNVAVGNAREDILNSISQLLDGKYETKWK